MKITGFKIVSLVVLILGAYLGIKIYIEYKNSYTEKRINVIKSTIEYDAKRCYIDASCSGEITINDLYDKGYLDYEFTNPIDNEPMSREYKINYDENNKEANLDWSPEVSKTTIAKAIKLILR